MVRDIAFNDVKRYKITEELAEYVQVREAPLQVITSVQPDDEFVESLGVWREPSSGLHFCPACRSNEKRSPLKKKITNTVPLVVYFDDPSRPRRSDVLRKVTLPDLIAGWPSGPILPAVSPYLRRRARVVRTAAVAQMRSGHRAAPR